MVCLYQIWDVPNPIQNSILHSHTAPVNCIIETKDLVISGSDDASIRVFDLIRLVCIHTIHDAHVGGVACLLSVSDTLFSAGKQGLVKVTGSRRVAGRMFRVLKMLASLSDGLATTGVVAGHVGAEVNL